MVFSLGDGISSYDDLRRRLLLSGRYGDEVRIAVELTNHCGLSSLRFGRLSGMHTCRLPSTLPYYVVH